MAMYPLSIDCKYCGKSFFSKSHLIVHLYTETCMKNHLLFIASIVVNLSFLRVTLLFSEATMERGLSNVSIARKPFSLVWLRRWTLRWLLEKKDLPQYLQWRAFFLSAKCELACAASDKSWQRKWSIYWVSNMFCIYRLWSPNGGKKKVYYETHRSWEGEIIVHC